jgi:hypothetical protein
MASRITRTLITILTLIFLSQTLAFGQDQPTTVVLPAAGTLHTWQDASLLASSGRKIFVITMAHPTQRIACRVQSFTADQLVCKGPFGTTRIHKPQEVAALITAGDNDVRLRLLLILNGASAAAAWGTFVLAATCIPCAVATGVVAALIFFANGAVLMADGQPEALLYLAPAQLQAKLH